METVLVAPTIVERNKKVGRPKKDKSTITQEDKDKKLEKRHEYDKKYYEVNKERILARSKAHRTEKLQVKA